MVSRFTHVKGDTVPLGTYLSPLTTRELLKRMELLEATREHKQAAIDAWLSCHEPLPVLVGSLEYHGFLPRGDDVEKVPSPSGVAP